MSYMTNDPRSALNRLIAAFEAHLDAAATGDELSPAVVAAENTLQDAFFTYDDSLFTAYGIELPFEAFDSDSDDDDDEDYDDGEYDEDDEEDDYDEDYDDEDGLTSSHSAVAQRWGPRQVRGPHRFAAQKRSGYPSCTEVTSSRAWRIWTGSSRSSAESTPWS